MLMETNQEDNIHADSACVWHRGADLLAPPPPILLYFAVHFGVIRGFLEFLQERRRSRLGLMFRQSFDLAIECSIGHNPGPQTQCAAHQRSSREVERTRGDNSHERKH